MSRHRTQPTNYRTRALPSQRPVERREKDVAVILFNWSNGEVKLTIQSNAASVPADLTWYLNSVGYGKQE